MEELKRTKRITIATIIAVLVLLIAIFSYQKPLQYKMSAEDMAYDLMMAYHVSPDEAMELMWDSTVIFVDMRTVYEYQADHIGKDQGQDHGIGKGPNRRHISRSADHDKDQKQDFVGKVSRFTLTKYKHPRL